jgi:hypothetical protein
MNFRFYSRILGQYADTNIGHDRLLTFPYLFIFRNYFQILLDAITLSERKVYRRN